MMQLSWRRALQAAAVAAVGFVLASAEEEEEASPTDMGIAATLLGMVGFVMVLYYFLNWPDPDVRQYSYEAVSSTISIFCAVLSFQALDNFLEVYITNNLPELLKVLFDMVHMSIWFLILQGVLAYVTGAIGGDPDQLEEGEEKERALGMRERNVKCFGILLAHISGFAAINAFGSMQQCWPFSANPFISFLAAPIAAIVLFGLFHTMNIVRNKVAVGDDNAIDEAEAMWDEETEEAEDDVFGLAISFLCVQSLRFLICGSLANEEGEEEEEVLTGHSIVQVLLLTMCASGFAALLFGVIFAKPPEEEEEEEEVDAEVVRTSSQEKKALDAAEAAKRAEAGERSFFNAALAANTMAFAWTVFFCFRWFLARTSAGKDEMILAVFVALSVSIISMVAIIPLDKLADMDCTGDKTDEAIISLIRGLGILIGFAWEQCFDQAVASLASGFGHAAGAVKLAMAIFVVAIIVPAWHMYILPFMVEKGWKTGFVVEDAVKNFNKTEHEDLKKLPKEERSKDREKTEKLLKACKARIWQHMTPEERAAAEKAEKEKGGVPSEGAVYTMLPGSEAEAQKALRKEMDTLKAKFSEHVEGSLKHSQAMMDRLRNIQAKMPLA